MVRLAYVVILTALALSLINAQSGILSNASANSMQAYATNLTISDVYVPSNVSINSPLPVSFNITNTGKYASGNIIVNLQDYGFGTFNISVGLPALSPGQASSVFLYLNRITSIPGIRPIYISSAYTSDGKIFGGGSASAAYTVINSGFAGAQGNFSGTLPNLNVQSIPFVYYLNSAGGSVLSQLQLLYTGMMPITMNMNVPGIFSNLVSLSARSLYMQRNQTLGSGFLIKTGQAPYETTYVMPINLTMVNGSKKFTDYRYMILSVLNMSTNRTFVSEQSNLLNNSNEIEGTLQINSPINANLANVKVDFIIPTGVGSSLQGIDTYGSSTQVSANKANYTLSWNVGNIGNDQNVYLYYNIGDVDNASAFKNSDIVMY